MFNWFRKKPEAPPLTWISHFDRYDGGPLNWTDSIHAERIAWLNEVVGKNAYSTCQEDSDLEPGVARIYGFLKKSDAVLFKLAWGGS